MSKLTPYYQDDNCEIYHGNCEDLVPSMARGFDLLLTDPPYGIGADSIQAERANTQRGAAITASKDYGSETWDQTPPSAELLDMLVASATRAIVWGGNYFQLPPAPGWLVWDKVNGSNAYADVELAWTNLPIAARLFQWRWHGMLQQHGGARKEARFHPTQKPLALMKWCISKASARIKIDKQAKLSILDPFMGSGTTLRAAKDEGMQCVGVEREERYCEIAASRLEQGVLF